MSNIDYEKFKIKEFKNWSVYLHVNQYYLGRCYIWSHRKDLVDLMDTNQEEKDELFNIASQLKKVLTELFKPNLFNWVFQGNVSNQLHMHVVPRYKGIREFNKIKFEDGRWGMNYAPYNYDFETPKGIRMLIKEKIVRELE